MGCAASSACLNPHEGTHEAAGTTQLETTHKVSVFGKGNGGENGRRRESPQRRTSGLEDPLSIGKESESVSAPTRWVIVVGTRSSGKSTLIRQLKFAYDGFDEAEALRYVKEVHKTALDACREVVKQLRNLDSDKQAIVDRVLKLRRRAPISLDVARDLKTLWLECQVTEVIQRLQDAQLKLACKHFFPKLDELASSEYVPDMQDMTFLSIPTMGQLETRLQNFPGGPVSMFELNSDEECTLFSTEGHEKPSDLLGKGLSAIIFTSSIDDAVYPTVSEVLKQVDDQRDISLSPVLLTGASLSNEPNTKGELCFKDKIVAQEKKFVDLAVKQCVPYFVLLTKFDKLYSMQLPINLKPDSVRSSLESQLRTCASVPTKTTVVSEVRCLSLFQDYSNFSDFQDSMMQKAFPDDFDDDGAPAGLKDALYLSFFCFVEHEKKMLSSKGALPMLMMQEEKLTLQDHLWLQSLPNPLPNPKKLCATTNISLAHRLGKDNHDPMKANFWKALFGLSDMLGSFQPEYLGTLHQVPILVCAAQSALLLVIRGSFVSKPSFHLPHRLSWRPVSQVSQKIAHKFPGVELYKFSSGGSYKVDAEETNARMQPKDLHPIKWLGHLRDCGHSTSPSNVPLTPGTYVAALYILSGLDGFRVLLHQTDHALPPIVKVSNKSLSDDDWIQIANFGCCVDNGDTPTCTDDWAAAKSWMGPEVADETQFSMFQKFMFGVISLRQRLDRNCHAMHDELRYSDASHASSSLASLGSLHTKEIVTLDRGNKVHLIVVTRVYNISVEDSLPGSMHWYPLALFEARHYHRFFGEAFDAYCTGMDLCEQHLGRHQFKSTSSAASPAGGKTSKEALELLRSSGMRGSAFGSVTSADDNQERMMEECGDLDTGGAEQELHSLLEADRDQLDSLWEPLRWTKRLLIASVESLQNASPDRCQTSAHPAGVLQHTEGLYESTVSISREIVNNAKRYIASMTAT